MTFYEFTAGDFARSSEVNSNNWELLKTSCDNAMRVEDNLDVMDIIDSPFKVVDLFTDSNGHKNTVDTGNTTAKYSDSLYYQCSITGNSSDDTETAETSMSLRGSNNTAIGYRIYANVDCVIVSATKYADSTATRLSLQKDSGTAISTATYSGNTATFSTPQILIAGNYYRLVNDNSGSNYNQYGNSVSSSFPYSGTNIDFVSGYDNGSIDVSNAWEIVSAVTQTGVEVDSLIQSSAQSVGTGYNYAYVRPKLYEAIPTGTDVTAQISLDGGSTWSSEFDINEIYDVSALTDTGSLKARIQLDTDTGATLTPKITGWSVVLFK